MVTKRAYSKTMKVFLYGSTGLVGLLAFLFTLTNYGISVELNQTEIIKCAGNSLEPCEAYFNISLSSWNLCTGSNFKLYLNDTEGVSYALFKADKRFKADNPARWKPYEFSGCLKNESKYEFKVVVNKPIDKTIKWGLTTGLINDIDPVFSGYNVKDFITIEKVQVELIYSEARIRIKNPTSFNIPIDRLLLSETLQAYKGGNINGYELKELVKVPVSANVTDFAEVCNNFEINHLNGTIEKGRNCSRKATSWHWENRTSEEKMELSSKTLPPSGEMVLILKVSYPPKLGDRNIYWDFSINVSGVKFTYE